MSFAEAVRTVYTQKFADFSGRARRSEFWFGYLAYFIVGIVVDVIARAAGVKWLIYILALIEILPLWSSVARRLHDTGRSGWWQLLYLTVIGVIVVIVWLCLDTDPAENKYGPSPKGQTGFNPNMNPNPNWGQN